MALERGRQFMATASQTTFGPQGVGHRDPLGQSLTKALRRDAPKLAGYDLMALTFSWPKGPSLRREKAPLEGTLNKAWRVTSSQ
ncbi:MAG: hypothetical protein LBI10_09395 [Deltaproteobacteria bacterium]|nr:hypothetical protein [Deltaproteobacteria bacterium]